ncbi:uncharacterized protein METZ01_LOCUS80917 [marine metagenome]|uniref:Uncharacterized protein n=1 Tax=marine metagenome TaxID=408172 RepID=A0A381UMM2_9ZZZZ
MKKKKTYPHLDWKMTYKDIPYKIETNPPEGIVWSPKSYKLKKSNIKLLTKMDRTTAATIRQEIYDDIIESENND